MSGEALHADLRVKDAGRIARRAEDLVALGAAERDVADDLRRHLDVAQDAVVPLAILVGGEDGDPPLHRLLAMEVGDPEVAYRVERAAVAAAAAEVIEE